MDLYHNLHMSKLELFSVFSSMRKETVWQLQQIYIIIISDEPIFNERVLAILLAQPLSIWQLYLVLSFRKMYLESEYQNLKPYHFGEAGSWIHHICFQDPRSQFLSVYQSEDISLLKFSWLFECYNFDWIDLI